ncbi:uncharacterized protein F4812DRAFT_457918 [Daldinia caldariorum]|uniref:uncharacterized protein n=1 Tax=Daldinia caldariorum TaxID=326644 RepID=UPI0020087D92|nr:uncharacterized protein F4812DRAFT_457918 [Daldinia caldariorum]KAI1469380.1 hypothetical protein F4812DRAFT_457918 [Daldinia caldariorum]
MATSPPNPPKTMDFYDIAMNPPAAVNPWKSRLALNFKKVPYKTTWVPVPEIGTVRRALGVPACRRLADGSDFYTLPVLADPNTGSAVGDSFDIAAYLQATYPDSGAGDLFPPLPPQQQQLEYTYDQDLPTWAPPLTPPREDGRHAEYARFNMHVDRAFSAHVGLMGSFLGLDSQASRDALLRRAGAKSWDDLEVKGEAREKMVESLRGTLGGLARLFETDSTGPFILGQKASYADLVVGGWVCMMRGTLPEEEWREVVSWHGGTFGRLFDALQQFAEVK